MYLHKRYRIYTCRIATHGVIGSHGRFYSKVSSSSGGASAFMWVIQSRVRACTGTSQTQWINKQRQVNTRRHFMERIPLLVHSPDGRACSDTGDLSRLASQLATQMHLFLRDSHPRGGQPGVDVSNLSELAAVLALRTGAVIRCPTCQAC